MKLGKMQYRGTIAVDIDGVLANFEKKFCEDFGYENRDLYSLEARYPELDPALIKEYVNNPDNYVDLEPIFGGLLFCRQAHQRGWYILLVTSRNPSLADVTRQWLAKYGAVYHELMFAKDKREAIYDWEEIEIWDCKKPPVSIVVDDSVSVLESMPEKYCVAWDSEWNYGYYPRMYYATLEMKLMLEISEWKVVGAWDKVGKYEY